MPQLPLVSICIPAYNAERFIAETLESALRQDYPMTEIIVSDDCSTDHTAEIVRQYEGHGVNLLTHGKNLGRYPNCNAVILGSSGDYICKLDADDLLAPEYISSLVSVMEAHPQVAFAHCACRLIDADGKFLGYERSVHGSFIRNGLEEWPRYVYGPRAINIVMLRRSAFDAVGGYDERFAYSGDWKMHRDLLGIGDVFYHDKILASYRVHSVGKTGVQLMQAREHLMHLDDMDSNWPNAVPGKYRLLARARYGNALGLVRNAARTSPDEAKELLKFLPDYGNFISVRILAEMVRIGGSPFLRWYIKNKLWLRQRVKGLLYKDPGSINQTPSLSQPGK